MMRLMIACSLILFSIGATDALGGTPCPEMEGPFPAPASEVAEIVSGWLADQGYVVRQDVPRPGYIHLTAWKSAYSWDVTVMPRSALASVATVIHAGDRLSVNACQRLRDHLEGYLLGIPSGPPSRPPHPQPPSSVPSVVWDRSESVVCIRTRSGNREIQFSGFVIDPKGLVLCTAHDLSDHQGVTVTFQDGVSVPGNIVRLDLRRDLALVACPIHDRPGFVSIPAGRNLLGMGESVFSIGCPNNLGGTLAPGTITGPPRLVNDQALWQVEMDIYPGSSGSPVFDTRGALVAMVKGRFRGTSTVGFLTPLETMIAFLLNENE